MQNDVPDRAILIRYCYGKVKGFYYVWENGPRWCWSAAGNQGQEGTVGKAQEAARAWIVDNFDRNNKHD